MDIRRRDFIKGCAAACALSLPGIAGAAALAGDHGAPAADAGRIEKSIKAGFGGGFSLRSHARSGGLTYADIEHLGNRYTVASTDLLDWKIVGAL